MRLSCNALTKVGKTAISIPRHLPMWRSAVLIMVMGVALAYGSVGCSAGALPSSIPSKAYQALHWRNVGPFRGGRTTAVAGVASQPYTFYIGSSGGGVWKTEDAGTSWHNISDGFFKVGSIGAIAVDPSNPETIYVGTGEGPVRLHSTSPGDGIYKSTDGGKTWKYLGLKETRHISTIVVDPNNANVVYASAEGNPWKPTEQRGVYRSRDGGETWQKVLFINETTGAHGISIDRKNPEVLYAAMWDHRVKPWYYRSGGAGSGLWKSTDGGSHWQRLKEGLPELMGKTAVSVSPADPNRVYAMIEAVHGGVFRSDDAGKTWRRVNNNHGLRARPWYYTYIFADPTDKNTVHVLGNTWGKSVDGGKTFTSIRTPHGDHHDLWINPNNDKIMVEGNDGGGTVSLNGGRTWSSEHNQPTGQFYRVFVDNGFPYRLYGGQQDRQTVSLPNFGIDSQNVYGVGGGESAQISMDADNPELVYATGLLGKASVYNQKTGISRNISPWPKWSGYRNAKDLKYRFNWSPPVVVSQHDPNTVYMGTQMVLKTTDRGHTWKEVSPDLTRNDKSKQGTPSGPIYYGGGAGYWTYGVINYIEQSPLKSGILWTGSDDGLVHLTRDGGKHWTDVTPPGMNHAYVHSIEASPHDPAKAYVVASRYRFGDYQPMIYRTDDYGRSWKLIVKGIPADDFARVVREDPTRTGLLYAGTNAGLYISFNDGNAWQRFQLNLPIVPITDLKIHKNDLVASTEGRGFWVLDDLTPLYQLDDKVLRADMYLYAPGPAHRVNPSYSGASGPFGENPPNGVIIRYKFSEAPDTKSEPVVLEILGEDGHLIRKFTSTPVQQTEDSFQKGVRKLRHAPPVPAKAGMNSYVWDMRVGPYTSTSDIYRNISQVPYRVAPGTYKVRLVHGKQSMTQSFKIVGDPRIAQRSDAEWAQQQKLLGNLRELVDQIHRSHNRLRSVAQQAQKRMDRAAASKSGHSDVAPAGRALITKIGCWEQQYRQPKLTNDNQDYISYPSRSWAIPVFHLISLIDQGPPVTARDETVAHNLETRWSAIEKETQAIVHGPLAAFNASLHQAGLQTVELPAEASSTPPPVVQIKPGQCVAK